MSQTVDGREWFDMGGEKIELPPLVLGSEVFLQTQNKDLVQKVALSILDRAKDIAETNNATRKLFDPILMLPESRDQKEFGIACVLAEKYLELDACWQNGDRVIDWANECESHIRRKNQTLSIQDLWPDITVPYWIQLLADKYLFIGTISAEVLVGYRMIFNSAPEVDTLSPEFLLYLGIPAARDNYKRWKSFLAPEMRRSLPPEQFDIQVIL